MGVKTSTIRRRTTGCQALTRSGGRTTPRCVLASCVLGVCVSEPLAADWCSHFLLQPVSALAIDGPGARLTTGSHDYDIKMYDFGGMSAGQGKEGYKPFRSWEPAGSYHVSSPSNIARGRVGPDATFWLL